MKALAFCRDISHAIRMSQAMEDYYNTRYLTGKNSTGERVRAYKDLQDDTAELEILFTVDILNEGVDIPGVNMVLFLRPTDSQTIFIQQLGRGLRNYEGKQYVTVLDFIGNDYKRSVQIAFALGGLAQNFVVEKKLLASLVMEDFKSIGLAPYGVIIHLDELSKKEVLSFIDQVNFNTKTYLEQDYKNFKKYISSSDYPRHVDYLNNDYAPDLIKFEENLPAFDERQEAFVKYVSEMLPIVRPYEYLIIQKIVEGAGQAALKDIRYHTGINMENFAEPAFSHALEYMLKSGFFILHEEDKTSAMCLDNVVLNTEMDEYVRDLLEFGLGKYDAEFVELAEDGSKTFHLWSKYRKEQVQQLLLNNPKDIMKGTRIEDDVVYAYVTVVKSDGTKEGLKYVDGYIDRNTFQWETIANVSEKELAALKASKRMEIFVRKVDNEDGIQLPFTYIGSGKMEYIEGSKKANGAHLFRVPMEVEAPEDMYFDFRLPE